MTNVYNLPVEKEPIRFSSSKTDYFIVGLKKENALVLSAMLNQCLESTEISDDTELELLIIDEIRYLLEKKYYTCKHNARLELSRSYARTLFLWLNQYSFGHPLQTNLACNVVDQIYKQLV